MAILTSTKTTITASAGEIKGAVLLRFLVLCGAAALLYYFGWWLSPWRITSAWMALAFALTAAYTGIQLAGGWLLYLSARRRPAPASLLTEESVDLFLVACQEPCALVEQSLAAACAVRGKHETWLLDDGDRPELKELAKRLGAGYLSRRERTDAKAGNINAALQQTNGDILVVFDSDHAPGPDFLERTLGYFNDPAVGFVQGMLTFRNAQESWVARAAADSALDFYNPTSIGADGAGGATMIGTNSLVRRKALQSTGGYQAGLADDLATSVALHAAGWRSAYVPEPLAAGLAPADLQAWFTQQLKWARGVAEVVLTGYPKRFASLTWGQRLSYSVRGSYYWFGAFATAHLGLTIALLFGGNPAARTSFEQYLLHLFPLGLAAVLIRQAAFLTWRHASKPLAFLWGAITLVYATWPVYLLAWILAILRVPVGYRPTPKSANGRCYPAWVLPQLAAFILLVGGILYTLTGGGSQHSSLLIIFALLQSFPLGVILYQAARGKAWFDSRSLKSNG